MNRKHREDFHDDFSYEQYLDSLLRLAEEACNQTIPCLEDWINTTRFGEVNRRDKHALQAILTFRIQLNGGD
jgi:hypothetical protein